MSKLALDSLEIRRFRPFQHLLINKLGRVNLIVGKNNVGKSSLLEAVQLYCQRGYPNTIWQILRSHDESFRPSTLRSTVVLEKILLSLRYLFYGREDIRIPCEPIQIGPATSIGNTLSLSVGFFISRLDAETRRAYHQQALAEAYDDDIRRTYHQQALAELMESSIPLFIIQMSGQSPVTYPIDPAMINKLARSEIKEITCIFTQSDGLNKRTVAELWDNIALTNKETEILNALRIIAPGVEAISIVGDPNSTRDRSPIVKVLGIKEPIPIRSLGDGMQRMLGIALALVNAENGILLIDEIENGLHYSVQTDLWRLIFQLSQNLNVQVFATSHSSDCISSFQEAAQENDQEGILIRLEYKKGNVSPVIVDERQLKIATDEQIELR